MQKFRFINQFLNKFITQTKRTIEKNNIHN